MRKAKHLLLPAGLALMFVLACPGPESAAAAAGNRMEHTMDSGAFPEVTFPAADPSENSLPSETWTDEEFSEEMMEDMSDEEMGQLIEQYFQNVESGAADSGASVSEKVTDPPLKMEQEDGGSFRYTLPNGYYFTSTVPQGMISSEPVDVVLPAGAMGVVSRNDVANVFPDSWHFAEAGSYHVKILSYQPASDNISDFNVYEVNFYFTITGPASSSIGAVPAPDGFVITDARLDGEAFPAENERCVFLKEDGRYEIRYAAQTDDSIRAETVLVRDTTAPFLTFSKEPETGGIEGPVEFYPSEQNCEVMLIYNGSKGYAVSSSLTAAGNYELCVEDAAGNQRSYQLRIRQTYDLLDMRIIVGAAVIGAVLVLRLLFLRNHMRVT